MKAKITILTLLILPLSGCIYGPGFHGTKVVNEGTYNYGITMSLSPVPALGCSGVITRGLGTHWDLGVEAGGATPDNFALLAFRVRKEFTPSSILFGRIGYFGNRFPSFDKWEWGWYVSGEISVVKELRRNGFYWGYGIGLAAGPLLDSLTLELGISPYPQIFFGYQWKEFLMVELEGPWPKIGLAITRRKY